MKVVKEELNDLSHELLELTEYTELYQATHSELQEILGTLVKIGLFYEKNKALLDEHFGPTMKAAAENIKYSAVVINRTIPMLDLVDDSLSSIDSDLTHYAEELLDIVGSVPT